MQSLSWRRDRFLITTDPAHIPVSTLCDIFDSEEFYWCKSLSTEAMREMLDNCLCFGLYEHSGEETEKDNPSPPKFIGLARFITDYITFVYLTDVWIEPSQQGKGLGTWLVKCVDEAIGTMPDLRKAVLFTGDWERSVPFYKKLMGMNVVEGRDGKGLAVMEKKGRGHPSFGREGSAYR